MTPDQRPPIAQAPISLVLLAWNASAQVTDVVTAWRRFLGGQGRPFEIVLVDDGSRDDTALRAEALTKDQPELRILRHADTLGPGAALATGLGAVQHPLVCYAPCDKQFNPADLERLLKLIDGADLVTGYRVGRPIPGWLSLWDAVSRWLIRILLGAFPAPRKSWLGWHGWRRRWLARWVFAFRVEDAECPFRLFRRAILERMPIQARGPFVHVELLAKANHLGCLMDEAAVTWLPARAIAYPATVPTFARDFWRVLRSPDFGQVPVTTPRSPSVVPSENSAG